MPTLPELFEELIQFANQFQTIVATQTGSPNPVLAILVTQARSDYQSFVVYTSNDMDELITRRSMISVLQDVLRHELEVSVNNVLNDLEDQGLINNLTSSANNLYTTYNSFIDGIAYQIFGQLAGINAHLISRSYRSNIDAGNNGQNHASEMLTIKAQQDETMVQAAIAAIRFVQERSADDAQFYDRINSIPAFHSALAIIGNKTSSTSSNSTIKGIAEFNRGLDEIQVAAIMKENMSVEEVQNQVRKLVLKNPNVILSPAVAAPPLDLKKASTNKQSEAKPESKPKTSDDIIDQVIQDQYPNAKGNITEKDDTSQQASKKQREALTEIDIEAIADEFINEQALLTSPQNTLRVHGLNTTISTQEQSNKTNGTDTQINLPIDIDALATLTGIDFLPNTEDTI